MDGDNTTPNSTPSGMPSNPQPAGGTPGGNANDSAFWKFQGNQFILLVIYEVAVRILSMFLGWGFLGIIFMILNLAGLVLFIILIINIVNKQMKPLPVIGNLFTFIK